MLNINSAKQKANLPIKNAMSTLFWDVSGSSRVRSKDNCFVLII